MQPVREGLRRGTTMEKKQQQLECYKRAAEARRLAKAARDPAEKVDLFDVERGWLSLARATDEKDERAA
jgi:hypothetical protein